MMEPVRYYVPSESPILVNPETSFVYNPSYQFQLETDDNKLYLHVSVERETASLEIPEVICQQICEMARQNTLTDAAVNHILYPFKQELICKIPLPEHAINLSYLFSVARGYVLKNGQPAAIFAKGALHLDMFHDIYSLCFTVPFNDPSQTVIITSEEHILRDQEQVIFMILADNTVYQITASVKNQIFYLQQIIKSETMQYQEFFVKERPLAEILQRFTAKKSRLAMLRHS